MCLVNIPGYPGYQIDKSGNVFSLKSRRFLSYSIKPNWYPCVYFKIEGKRVGVGIHRLLALAFIANPLNLPEVNHIDGDKTNYELANLEWVSSSENIRHAFESGLTPDKNCIPYSDIPKIISDLKASKTWSDLAREYSVTDASTIRKLLKREFERQGKDQEWVTLTSIVKTRAVRKQSMKVKSTSEVGMQLFESLNDAGRFIGSSPASIWKAIKSGKEFKGSRWAYA